jgi:hypothetical protein
MIGSLVTGKNQFTDGKDRRRNDRITSSLYRLMRIEPISLPEMVKRSHTPEDPGRPMENT